MKNFDEERDARQAARAEKFADRDRSFILGGETFRYRLFIPFSVPASIAGVGRATSDASLIHAVNQAVPLIIEPEPDEDGNDLALRKWERAQKVVEYEDVLSMCFWIIAELSDRPTEASTPSGNGRERTGGNSTELFSSEAEASAA